MYKPLSGSLVFNSLYIYINTHFRVVWWGIICKQVRLLNEKHPWVSGFCPPASLFVFISLCQHGKNKEKHYLTCGSAFGFYPSELQSFVCKHLAAEKARLKMKPGNVFILKTGTKKNLRKGNKYAFFSSPCPQPCSKCKWCIRVPWNCFGN